MWTAPAPEPAIDEPLTGPDRPILEAFLASERFTLLNICAGLNEEQLADRPIATTNLSLVGIVRHLAKVERIWLRERVAGQAVARLFLADDDFENPEKQSAERAFVVLHEEIRWGDDAVRDLPFDHTFTLRGDEYALRMVYVHLISEYARHNGHADLIRQAIDGETGR